MRDLDTAIRQLMRLIGRTVRPAGFRGSVDRWWKVTGTGIAVITRDNHRRDATARGFGLRGMTVPAEWWRYQNWCRDREGLPPLPIHHPDVRGIGLVDHTVYALRGCPVERHAWELTVDPRAGAWPIPLEADLARAAAEVPVVVTYLMNRSLTLLEPGAYITELLDDPEQGPEHWEPLAVLLTERGDVHDDDLVDVLRRLVRSRTCGSDHVDRILGYVTGRVAEIRSSAG